jgi:hypothetical protein
MLMGLTLVDGFKGSNDDCTGLSAVLLIESPVSAAGFSKSIFSGIESVYEGIRLIWLSRVNGHSNLNNTTIQRAYEKIFGALFRKNLAAITANAA